MNEPAVRFAVAEEEIERNECPGIDKPTGYKHITMYIRGREVLNKTTQRSQVLWHKTDLFVHVE